MALERHMTFTRSGPLKPALVPLGLLGGLGRALWCLAGTAKDASGMAADADGGRECT